MEKIQKFIMVWLVLATLSSVLHAGNFDSSASLPVMKAAALETKTAGKAYADYLALRKKEFEIIAELSSPAFERLPRAERAVKKAESLVLLGQIVRDENARLITYKVHYGNAAAIYGKLGPEQIGAARAHLEGIRTAMAADIGERAATAGALAQAASLGGLTPLQKKKFKNYVKHLENKQAIEERLRGNSRDLETAAGTIEALVSYMEEVQDSIDLAIEETKVNIALNTGAKAVEIGKEISFQICGEQVCDPVKMFPKGPDHSGYLGDFGAEQPESEEDEKNTDDSINKYSRR